MDKDLFIKMKRMQHEHWWFQSRARIIEKVLKKLTPRKGQDLKILEIGAGVGANADLLNTLGTVTLSEGDEHAARILIEQGFSVAQGFLPGVVDQLEADHDLVVMIDVLEHIEDEREALNAIKRVLSKDGILFLTVPAFMLLWSAHDEQHAHFRRYTKGSLKRVLAAAGYKVRFISYYNMFLFPFIFLVRALKRLIGSDTHDLKMARPMINRLLYTIFSFEKNIILKTGMPFGASLCAVDEQK